MAFEGVEARPPGLPVRRQPAVELEQALRTQLGEPALTVRPARDDARLAQDP
jgi:hypothetical protein